MSLIVERTPLEGVLLFRPEAHGDARGFFLETFRVNAYAEAGLSLPFVQDNHSRSRRGILRGLHYQWPHPQGKLVTVMRGRVFDVVVDVRRGSPQFGRWHGVILDEENHCQLWVPPGFAHGFCVLSELADFMYKCTDYYRPECDAGLRWNDPDVGVLWPLDREPLLSAKDQRAPLLCEVEPGRLPLF